MTEKSKIQEIQDFMHANKDMLIIVANPKTDLIVTGFGDHYATVQFPFVSMATGIVFNALRKSQFNDAIDPLMVGLEKVTGIKVEDNQQLAHIIGGSIKNIGEARDKVKRRSALSIKRK